MKGKRNLLLALIVFALVLFGTTGCMSKTAVTKDKFIEVAESHNLETMDASSLLSVSNTFESATTAYTSDMSYSLTLYVFTSDDLASSTFSTDKALFEALKSSTVTEAEVSGTNYENYSLTTNNTYMYICRVDNTLLYVSIDEAYKDDVKTIIDDLGY